MAIIKTKFDRGVEGATNIVDSGTEGTKVASGTTAQRGSTTGQWRFNTTTGYFEGRNNSGEFSTLEPTPTVTGVDVTEVDSAAGGNQTFVISGTNFSSGAVASFVGSSANFNATSTTIDSTTQITAVAPKASFLNAQEPYKVKVTSTSGVSGMSGSGLISVDTSPTWTTSAGSLGSILDNATGNHFTVAASDPNSDTIAYSLQSGSLAGLSLNSSTGVISGDPTDVTSDTTNSFDLRATANGKTVDRSFSYITQARLENHANTLAYFDFASGKSYDGTSTLQDLTSRNKDLPLGNASYNSANGGVLIGSSTQNVRASGLIGSKSEISMGCWVKLDGNTNKGVIYYGDTSTNNHFFVRDGISGTAYNFNFGKDVSSTDTWTTSKYNSSDMANYITGVSGYASDFWYFVIRIASNGEVTTSLNKSTFETSLASGGGTINGHSAGQFGIFGDPYDDNSSNHTIGVAWWYDGVISQALSDSIYDRYATRFGY